MKNGTIRKCKYECKDHHTCAKNYSLNPSKCICENDKLESIYWKIKRRIKNFDFANILIEEISYENIPFCNISYITLTGTKPIRIRFNKLDGLILNQIYLYNQMDLFIKKNRCLVVFGFEKI